MFNIQIEGKEPVRIGQYSIPPGVDVYPGLRFIMFDEEHWDGPHEFRPERFIDQDTGEVILNNPRYVPFQVYKYNIENVRQVSQFKFMF